MLLLENLRFHGEEEENDPEFAKQLATLCDIYVNRIRFGASRARVDREHDSVRAESRRRAPHGAGVEVSRHGRAQPTASVRGDFGRRQPVGRSLVEDDKLELARKLVGDLGNKLVLPVDHTVVSEIAPGVPHETARTIPADKIAVDIGPKTVEQFAQATSGAKMVIWNGPMGIFEKPPFDSGTVAVAKAVAGSGAIFHRRRRFGKGD